jgi:hypothetical protein
MFPAYMPPSLFLKGPIHLTEGEIKGKMTLMIMMRDWRNRLTFELSRWSNSPIPNNKITVYERKMSLQFSSSYSMAPTGIIEFFAIVSWFIR